MFVHFFRFFFVFLFIFFLRFSCNFIKPNLMAPLLLLLLFSCSSSSCVRVSIVSQPGLPFFISGASHWLATIVASLTAIFSLVLPSLPFLLSPSLSSAFSATSCCTISLVSFRFWPCLFVHLPKRLIGLAKDFYRDLQLVSSPSSFLSLYSFLFSLEFPLFVCLIILKIYTSAAPWHLLIFNKGCTRNGWPNA